MTKGKCAKTQVKCTIISTDGKIFVGENYCENPQNVCPRNKNEGYDKCLSVCKQVGHAEQVAVNLAGENAKGASAYLEGHTYYCMDCQLALFGAGVESLHLVK